LVVAAREPGSHNDALTGDLIERFREGQTRGWFWRQVLIAFAVGVAREIQWHWQAFCYAAAGMEMPGLLSPVFGQSFLHWFRLWDSLAWWTPAVGLPEAICHGIEETLQILEFGSPHWTHFELLRLSTR